MKDETYASTSLMRSIVQATLVAATLDIASAFAYGWLEGHPPIVILVGIASAVWPDARHAPVAAAFIGLLVHVAIMLVMVVVFALMARRLKWPQAHPVCSGCLYGLFLWAAMNLVVLPWRWPAIFPHFTALTLGEQWFSHIVLVGVPIAWLTRPGADARGVE